MFSATRSISHQFNKGEGQKLPFSNHDASDFKKLVSSLKAKRSHPTQSILVKQLDDIPHLYLSSPKPRKKSLILSKHILIRKFAGS
jgi:hypothetical protein